VRSYEKTSFIIVDAQSVKNTDTAENKGYDAGKKVSGIKRHIAVDTQVYKWLFLLLLGYFSKEYDFFAFIETK
jgi:Transposase DDE domain